MALRSLALQALCEPDVEQKLALTLALQAPPATVSIASEAAPPAPAHLPGRPARPELIDPAQVPQRSVHTPEGRAALVHAICHIEFNAIKMV